MKKLFTLFTTIMMCHIVLFAQQEQVDFEEEIGEEDEYCYCEEYLIEDTEFIQGEATYSLKDRLWISNATQKKKIQVDFMVTTDANAVSFYIVMEGNNRKLEKKDIVTVIFEDDSELKLKNVGMFDDKKEIVIKLGKDNGAENELRQLTEKRIKNMIVNASGKDYKFMFTRVERKQFIETIKCIALQMPESKLSIAHND